MRRRGRFGRVGVAVIGLATGIGVAGAAAQEPPSTGGDGDRQAVLEVVERLFEGMRAGDSALVRSTFHPEARLISTGAREGEAFVRAVPADRFVEAVGEATGEWEEPIWDTEVRVEEGLATVWTKYAFYLDGEFSHCGVDAFILGRTADGWKIVSLADTRRQEGCGSPPDRFPGAEGRIPNFSGAERAAERLRETDAWRRASAVKANPDSPQWPVRQRALEDGKRVYMAVPRLATEPPFLLLDPEELEASARRSSSIKGAGRFGRPVAVEELEPVDLVVVGSVAASADGARLGKGGGYSDLEFAVAVEAGLIGLRTPVVTTVHDLQVAEPGEIPMTAHDVPLDLVVTPERSLETAGEGERPTGVRWDEISDEKLRSIPFLERRRRERRGEREHEQERRE